jgi:hypothetical protein
MKPILLAAVLSLALTGCGDSSSSPAKPSSGANPVDAPADYLKGAANAQKSAVKTVDTTAVDRAIQAFEADEGRHPKSLEELVEKKYMTKLPQPPAQMKYEYDAGTGTVKIVSE